MARQVCSPWTTPDKLCCAGAGTTEDCSTGAPVPLQYSWTDEDYILAASNILFARTCFLYPGTCSATVWPCIDCGCTPHPCACCGTYSAIQLPTSFDVISIVSVTEDGVVLDPSAYRLERGNVLVRMDGNRWQRNSFGLPGSECVETVIEYTAGAEPPAELQMAAAELACELKKACNGGQCALPERVTQVARRGVSFKMADLEALLSSGSTGLPLVDHALSVHGNCGGPTFGDPVDTYRFGWGVS